MNISSLEKIMMCSNTSWLFYNIVQRSSKYEEDDEPCFINTADNRKYICNKMKISDPTYFSNLKILVDMKIIVKGSRGNYYFDKDLYKLIRRK